MSATRILGGSVYFYIFCDGLVTIGRISKIIFLLLSKIFDFKFQSRNAHFNVCQYGHITVITKTERKIIPTGLHQQIGVLLHFSAGFLNRGSAEP
jgi:hypothetical protein